MSYDGSHCPKCGGILKNRSSLDEQASTTQIYREVFCPQCGTLYNETFRLAHLFEVDDYGHEGEDHMREDQ